MVKQAMAICAGLLFLMGLAPQAYAGSPGPEIRVFVSILPQKIFVERMGGERVAVKVLLAPGESPATYRPKPSLMASLADSDLFFRIGVPFETHLMPKIKGMGGNLQVVDTRKGVPLIYMGEAHHHDDDNGGHTEGNGAEGLDPHIWLDPLRVVTQVITMRDALIARDPQGKETYTRGGAMLIEDLLHLHQEISEALTPLSGETLYVFHPAFGYFADAYGLVQKAVEVDGKSPKGRALAQFIGSARADGVRVVFVQPQFDRHAAEKVAAAIDGAVIPLDPLAPDYFANLRDMAGAVVKALAAPGIEGGDAP